MVESKDEKLIRLKIGIVFSKLLQEVKEDMRLAKSCGKSTRHFNTSFGKLSSDTGLRAATLTEIFLGKSNPKATSIVLVLNSLGKSLEQFGQYFEMLSDNEVQDFILKNKSLRSSKKTATPPKPTAPKKAAAKKTVVKKK